MPKRPPAIAERLLRRLAPGREGDIIAGDLREEFEARGGGRLWYWGEVLSCVAVRLSPHRLTAPDLRQDLHYAVRVLRRNPGYALTAMVCLALGIGVNTTVFSMVNELFWQPLPLPHSGRLAIVVRESDGIACSYRDYLEFRQRASAPAGRFFSGLVAYDDMRVAIDSGGMSHIVGADAVTANFADVLELPAQLGRWFSPEDDRLGSDPVAVIGDGIWGRLFGRSPDAIGQRVRIGTQQYRVIGVAPAGFVGMSPPHMVEIWMPLASQPDVRDLLANPGEWERPLVQMIGRLADGKTTREAEAGMRGLDAQIRRDFPRENAPAGAITVAVATGASRPDVRAVAAPMAVLLLSVTSVVLLIACVNVANLILSRSAVRRHEMAVRRALGAGPWRLARQTLAEGLVLGAGGVALGLAVGYWSGRLLASSLPGFPHGGMLALRLDPDWRVVAYAAAAGLASAVLFTLAPAMDAVRSNAGVSRRMRQRDVYVVAQVALSLVLLIAATLLARALGHALEVDPGFAMAGRLEARLSVTAPEYTADTGRLFLDRVLAAVQAMPNVRSATLSHNTPLSITDGTCAAPDTHTRPRRAGSDIVAAGYFDTLGIRILRGRAFEARDRQGAPQVVVVNETFARRYWPGRDPIGQSVWLGCDTKGSRTAAQVVGVARDAKYSSLDEPRLPFVYRPLAQDWAGFMTLIVHTAGRPEQFTAPLRAALAGLDPNLRVYEIETLEECASGSLFRVRWQAALLAVFGGLAMLLAAVGLYGVVAYTVAQQTRELGIRMAIGAQRADLLWMVLGRGLRLTAVGIAIGLLLSAAATRLLGGLLYGMSPLDPVSFAAASLAWTAVAMLASYVPARRAM
ncbi:MAG: ABC transporter permease, partial [Bryobacteraceae bacterium]